MKTRAIIKTATKIALTVAVGVAFGYTIANGMRVERFTNSCAQFGTRTIAECRAVLAAEDAVAKYIAK